MIQIVADLTTSSIGKKFIMAVTGLGAISFLVVHLGGNVLVFAGRARFDTYAHHLHSFVFLPVLEYALFALFAVHAFLGAVLTIQNWRARPIGYAVKRRAGAATVASSTMIYSGLALLGFLILHLWTVDFGVRADMPAYDRVVRAFTNPGCAACYILGILALGLHLYHGASSTLESLGLNHPSYERFILMAGRLAAVVLTAGFLTTGLFVMFARSAAQ